jgi:hypothetical protein
MARSSKVSALAFVNGNETTTVEKDIYADSVMKLRDRVSSLKLMIAANPNASSAASLVKLCEAADATLVAVDIFAKADSETREKLGRMVNSFRSALLS